MNIYKAHVTLIAEMGPDDDAANERSLGILLAAIDQVEQCEFYQIQRPQAADPWIARARAILSQP